MADVRLSIANREYIVTCQDGEEERLRALGSLVDDKAREAGGAGGLNESRTLLYSALLLADKLHDGGGNASAATSSTDSAAVEEAANTLEKLADRLEALAAKLED